MLPPTYLYICRALYTHTLFTFTSISISHSHTVGLGPPGSNAGEVLGLNGSSTPTFVENLLSQGAIDEPVFGIYVNSLNVSEGSGGEEIGRGEGSGSGAQEIGRGEIVFGGWDEGRVDGPLTWVPQNEPYNFHWEFNVRAYSCLLLFSFPRSHYMDTHTHTGLEFRRWEYDARERDDARADGYRGIVYRSSDVRLSSMHPSSLYFLSTLFERIPSSTHHPSRSSSTIHRSPPTTLTIFQPSYFRSLL